MMTKKQANGAFVTAGMVLVAIGVGIWWFPLTLIWIGLCAIAIGVGCEVNRLRDDG